MIFFSDKRLSDIARMKNNNFTNLYSVSGEATKLGYTIPAYYKFCMMDGSTA